MAIKSDNNIHYRYPGTKFFEADQNDIFFGRSEETDSLIHAIKAHDIFVIFADSGIGKTSLLNAGILPQFENENDLEKIMPVKFRFQDTGWTPLQIIAKKLSEFTDAGAGVTGNQKQTLWHLFKDCHFKDSKDSKDKIPLLIFDQFEEFFNHRKPDREACINELSDLINQYLPDYIRDEMTEQFSDRKPTAAEMSYYTQPRLKMLFLIRADKLKLMDDLSKKIPVILRNRFHLKPLNIRQAKEAILFPASLPRNGFASPSFGFQDEAVQQICAYLKNEEDEVESFQLQILCQELEKRVMEGYAAGAPDAVFITEKELGGEAGMNDITKNYYINKINAITDPAMRRKAVELIEDKLIVEDRRISQAERLLLNEGYSRELLDYLLGKTRLIRIDNDAYIEISHDRLLPSILNLKLKRKEAEEKEAAIQQVKEEEERQKLLLQKRQEEDLKKLQLEYLQDKVKKAAKLRVFIMILIALLASVVWMSVNADRAKTRTNIAFAKYYIGAQDYDNAAKAIAGKTLFSAFNFSLNDSIQWVQDSITSGIARKKLIESLLPQADTLCTDASAIVADYSLRLANNTTGYEQPGNKITNFNFIDSAGKKLILAWNLCDSAKSSWQISEVTGGYINNITESVRNTTGSMLELINKTTSLLLEAGEKEKAGEIYSKGQQFVSLAGYYYMPFNTDDTLYFNSLYNKLHNEKKSIVRN